MAKAKKQSTEERLKECENNSDLSFYDYDHLPNAQHCKVWYNGTEIGRTVRSMWVSKDGSEVSGAAEVYLYDEEGRRILDDKGNLETWWIFGRISWENV